MKEIQKFQKIIAKETNQEITDNEAKIMLTQLYLCFHVFMYD